MTPTLIKIGKNQFKCFHCRTVFAQRDGNWYGWNSMEVHLCKRCNKLTEHRPERIKTSPTPYRF